MHTTRHPEHLTTNAEQPDCQSSILGDENLDPFAPELFERHAALAVSKLKIFIEDRAVKGLKLRNPQELMREAKSLMAAGTGEAADPALVFRRLASIMDLYVSTGIPVYSPGCMGRQFSGVIPLAAVVDLLSSILSQPASFYEAAQLPSIADRLIQEEFARYIGWDAEHCGMITTSGGSLANLTAMLTARNVMLANAWSTGVVRGPNGMRPAIAASAAAHYSITRAAGVLGIGEDQIVKLPTNDREQIDVDAVEATLAAARVAGLETFCLVASAGTTSVGAFDDLSAIADITDRHNIWLHVDGAHGGSLLLSPVHRHKLKGVDRADSLSWDAHKMLLVPATCTLLFYKDKEKSNESFHQDATYVFEKDPSPFNELNSGERNFECTKRPMIMPLWICWAIYGAEFFAKTIERACGMATQAYEILRENEPDFFVVTRPEANILCFRYRPSGLPESEISDLQLAIWETIRAEGRFFFSKDKVQGRYVLRVVFMNQDIEPLHFRALLQEIRRTGDRLARGQWTENGVKSSCK